MYYDLKKNLRALHRQGYFIERIARDYDGILILDLFERYRSFYVCIECFEMYRFSIYPFPEA